MTLADIVAYGHVAKLYWPSEHDAASMYYATLVPADFVVGLVRGGQRGVRVSLRWDDEPQEVMAV